MDRTGRDDGYAVDYAVDPARTTLGWSVQHLFGLGWVRGTFADVDGTVEMAGGVPVSARAEIQVEPFDTGNPRRDAHLRSPDFFWAEHHPTIQFESTRIEPAGDGAYRVAGTLTVRGVAAPVVLDAHLAEGPGKAADDGRLTVRMTGTLDRRDVGMVWRRGIGSLQMAGDEVRLDLTVGLTRHAAGAPRRHKRPTYARP